MPSDHKPVGDTAARHHSVRRGRERGCWVYIPKTVLEASGVDPDGPPPDFRVYTTAKRKRRAVLVQLYERDPATLAPPADETLAGALHRRAVEAAS